MKPIEYGQKPSKNRITGELCALIVFIIIEAMFTYVLLMILFQMPNWPVYFFWIYLVLQLIIAVLRKQHHENKQCYRFDEEAIHILTYPNWLYFNHKEPDEVIIPYQNIESCDITYEKLPCKGNDRYGLCFHITYGGKECMIRIDLAGISEKELKELLILIMNQVEHLQDPYQLYLCLLQNYVKFDTYIERIKGKESI